MTADILKQRALEPLRQAVENPTAVFRQRQWEAIEDLLLRRAKLDTAIGVGG